MLKSVVAVIPVTDIEISRNFYINIVGLQETEPEKNEDGGILLKAVDGTKIYLYERPPAKSEHTLASFESDDLEKDVSELMNKGIKFEQYDIPNGIKTDENGIATMGDWKSAWFKDPDGNILGLSQI